MANESGGSIIAVLSARISYIARVGYELYIMNGACIAAICSQNINTFLQSSIHRQNSM